MTERQIFVLRAILLFANSNLNLINDMFSGNNGEIDVNGEEGEKISPDEVENLLDELS
jgi:hypothetical protein